MNSEIYIEFSSNSRIYELLKKSSLCGKNSLKMLIWLIRTLKKSVWLGSNFPKILVLYNVPRIKT